VRNLSKTLDQEEKVELARMLHQDLNVPDINLLRSTMNMDQKVLCPHCGTDDIYGHGGLQRPEAL
jgi:hypothetical protein